MRSCFLSLVAETDRLKAALRTLKELENSFDPDRDFLYEKYDQNKSHIRDAIYSGAIVALYGAWENFIRKICVKYFYFLKQDELSHFKIEYVDRACEYLTKKDREWKKSAEHVQFLSDLNDVNNDKFERISFEVFFKNFPNYRSKTLSEIFNIFKVNGILDIIINDSEFVAYFNLTSGEDLASFEPLIKNKKAFEVLDDLIFRRNAVAHGNIDDNRLGYNELCDYIEYIINVARPIYKNLMFKSVLANIDKHRTLVHIEKLSSQIGLFSSFPGIKTGSEVVEVKRNNKCNLLTILSMQFKDVDVHLTAEHQEISIKFNRKYDETSTLKLLNHD